MTLLDSLDVYADGAYRSAALNMALDEALFQTATTPTLRFYQWAKPAISFGYFGRYADVEQLAPAHDIVRRWTGGGIVVHGTDLTYSFVLPAVCSAPSSRRIYSAVHSAIRAALAGYCPAVTLASSGGLKISEACFANPVRDDVLMAGRKVAGAAQRRTRTGLLHQGSIQLPDLPPDFREQFARALCAKPRQKALAPTLIARADAIAATRYATDEWLRRR